MSSTKLIHLTSDSANQRIDKFISSHDLKISRSSIQRLINIGKITVSGKIVKSSYKLKEGDKVIIEIPEPESSHIKPEFIPLDIVYEDESLIVVNKPAGMVVHPAAGNYSGTLVNALLYHCKNTLSGIGGIERPGIVHRLDKDTSGLLMVAKDDFTHLNLSKQLKDRTIARKYMALVKGNIKENSGKIEMPIGRHLTDRKKMSTKTKRGRFAVTEFKVIERFNEFTLIDIKLKTGRTHQIRVHLSSIGYSVAGDKLYGGGGRSYQTLATRRQMLHAYLIGFVHPKTGRYLEFTAPVPTDMEGILKILRTT